jgi:arylsulfatase A-like enzyme
MHNEYKRPYTFNKVMNVHSGVGTGSYTTSTTNLYKKDATHHRVLCFFAVSFFFPFVGCNLFGGFGERVLRRHAAINEQQGLAEPLFMYLAYTVTHAPEQAPAEYVDRYPADWVTGRRLYAGMASALDDSVGNITRTLKEVGMWPNTLVIFSSDKCVGATVVPLFHMLCCDARPV